MLLWALWESAYRRHKRKVFGSCWKSISSLRNKMVKWKVRSYSLSKNYVSNIMFRFGIEQTFLQLDEFFPDDGRPMEFFRTQEIGGRIICSQEEVLHRGRYWERWKLMFPLMRSIWYSGRNFYEEALVNSTRDKVYAIRRKQLVGLNSFLLKHYTGFISGIR